MGHIRLGRIPKSRTWAAVVSAVSGETRAGADDQRTPSGYSAALNADALAIVASRTLDAAGAGLDRAVNDAGLRQTFYLLSQVALAAREPEWRSRLAEIGIRLRQDSTIFDLTAEFQAAIDSHLLAAGNSTDVSEIAQRAAGEAICKLAADRAETLFGNSGRELQSAVYGLSTKNGFGALGHAFFAQFLTHYLNFYLSRVTASEIGRGPIRSVGDISRFNSLLARHCEQSAEILRDFAGEWFSKTQYETGITLENSGGFVAVAVKKLQAELRSQKSGQ